MPQAGNADAVHDLAITRTLALAEATRRAASQASDPTSLASSFFRSESLACSFETELHSSRILEQCKQGCVSTSQGVVCPALNADVGLLNKLVKVIW
jgi:hypothetical protein